MGQTGLCPSQGQQLSTSQVTFRTSRCSQLRDRQSCPASEKLPRSAGSRRERERGRSQDMGSTGEGSGAGAAQKHRTPQRGASPGDAEGQVLGGHVPAHPGRSLLRGRRQGAALWLKAGPLGRSSRSIPGQSPEATPSRPSQPGRQCPGVSLSSSSHLTSSPAGAGWGWGGGRPRRIRVISRLTTDGDGMTPTE